MNLFQNAILAFKRIALHATPQNLDPRTSRRVLVANSVALVFTMIGVPYTVAFYLAGLNVLSAVTVIATLSLTTTLLISHAGYAVASRIYLTVALNALNVAYFVALGPKAEIYFFSYPMAVFPFLYFSLEERKHIIFSVTLACTTYLLMKHYLQYLPGVPLVAVPEGGMFALGLFSNLIAFFGLLAPVYSFFSSNDVYEKRLAEQQIELAEASRGAALYQLAGGVAHEINNPLAILSALSEMCEETVKTQKPLSAEHRDKLERWISKIHKTAKRIAEIVASLRTLTETESEASIRIVSAQEVVQHAVNLSMEQFTKAGIELIPSYVHHHPSVQCNHVQIGQVLLSLLKNSFDAVKDLEEKWVRINILDGPDAVRIEIVDSGTGIPANILSRIFDPFFSTKAVGSGMGLGLSLARQMLRNQQSDLLYTTKDGHTCFHFSLHKEKARDIA